MRAALPGGCLCGAVRFTAAPEKMVMDACHCVTCRRWTGGPWMTVSCTELTIEPGAPVQVFDSSEWADRSFCGKCGSTLFYRMKDGRMIAVGAQTFDDASQFKFASEIYYDQKPDNYAFANVTHKMTGDEVAALFAPGDEHDG